MFFELIILTIGAFGGYTHLRRRSLMLFLTNVFVNNKTAHKRSLVWRGRDVSLAERGPEGSVGPRFGDATSLRLYARPLTYNLNRKL